MILTISNDFVTTLSVCHAYDVVLNKPGFTFMKISIKYLKNCLF